MKKTIYLALLYGALHTSYSLSAERTPATSSTTPSEALPFSSLVSFSYTVSKLAKQMLVVPRPSGYGCSDELLSNFAASRNRSIMAHSRPHHIESKE